MKRLLVLLLLVGCAHTPESAKDPYLWLENIEGKEALSWVETQNKESLSKIGSDATFKKMEADALKIMESKDRIPSVGFQHKNVLVNFWQDDVHVRGIMRETSLSNYKKKDIKWTTILDIDALAKKENENWIFKGSSCLEPDFQYCLVNLSRGGKDAVVVREFDRKKKVFVDNGFKLTEAKTSATWVDKDTLLVATDFGAGSMTNSGYPRQIRLWKRGTKIETAKQIFEAPVTDVRVYAYRMTHKNQNIVMIGRGVDTFNSLDYLFDPKTGEQKMVNKPAESDLTGYFEGQLLYQLRKPWKLAGKDYQIGTVISFPATAVGRELKAEDVQTLYVPQDNQSFRGVAELKTKLVISLLEDVKSKLLVTQLEKGKWAAPKVMELSGTGNIGLNASTDEADMFMYSYENFNQPSTLYVYEFGKAPQKLKSLPDFFDAKDIVVDQKFATSADGTKVPYFLVYKKGMKFDGTAPTLQYGYGGFLVSQTAGYSAIVGKLWLEKGGVYVVANIRGGAEYGPKWHQAALKENRQKAYDDFIAVSEDLIKNKVTSAKRLAIRGGSNGGLLVGAVMAQRPELYGAVLCWVPLLDMMRYSQLLAGASWMGEYGDPTIPRYRRAIMKYSPYQNISADKTYPPILLVTSTKDDRVHPGHARKMAAKMKEQKHQVLYYENTEGGHAANANFKQAARLNALQYNFLLQTISK